MATAEVFPLKLRAGHALC